MKRIICLSMTILFGTGALYAGPKQEAEKIIRASHDSARNIAHILVKDDILNILVKLNQNSIMENRNYSEVVNSISELDRNIRREMLNVNNLQNFNNKKLIEIVKNFKSLIRARMLESYKAQRVFYERDLAVRSFEILISQFNSQCSTGRSSLGASNGVNLKGKIPGLHYDFMMDFGVSFGQDSSNLNRSSFSGSSISADESAKKRVEYTEAGSAAALAYAASIWTAPYTFGVSLAIASVLYGISSYEQAKAENEFVAAQVNVFLNSAKDSDVAKYYKEYCTSISNQFYAMQERLQAFWSSKEDREQLFSQIISTRVVRDQYRREKESLKEQVAIFDLHREFVEKGCSDELASNLHSGCIARGDLIYLKGSKEIIFLDLKSPADMERINLAIKSINNFNTKFNKELVIAYALDESLDQLMNYWMENESAIHSFGLRKIDSLINKLAGDIERYIFEIQETQDSLWYGSNNNVDLNVVDQGKFFSFQKEYFEILNLSVSVAFGKADKKVVLGKLHSLQDRYLLFLKGRSKSKSLESFKSSINSLMRSCEQL